MQPNILKRRPTVGLARLTLAPLLATLCIPLVAAPIAADEPHRPLVLLQMIRDDAVHQELGLTPSQTDRLLAELVKIDVRWWPGRNLPDSERQLQLEQLTKQLRERLRVILQPDQTERLTQLERQALGTRMLLTDDVAEALNLTGPQR